MVNMSSIAAENYHLKWDSHLSYLNLSLSSLWKSERYSDVMLLTSNSDSGPAIPAHRMILSSSSHFFASIFEGMPPFANGLTYIVLPSDLSRKAVQILVQYMYTGEATVSNDILTEVLRGGEILKIRGLCRNTATAQNQCQSADTKNFSNGSCLQKCCNRVDPPNSGSSGNSTINNLELRGLGASATVIPKESPVIVRSPKPQTSQQHPVSIVPPPSTPNITVNKEYAIDPDESSKSSSLGTAATHSHLSRISKKLHSSFGSLPGSSVATMTTTSTHESIIQERLRRHSEDALQASRSSNNLYKDEAINMSSRRLTPDQDAMDHVLHRKTSVPEHMAPLQAEESEHFQQNSALFSRECPEDGRLAENLDFLPIKEEPADWMGGGDRSCSEGPSNKHSPLDMVKVEANFSEDDDDDDDQSEQENNASTVYSPLTCELCSETFNLPGDWVRHIESHMDIPAKYIPKKRKRIANSTNDLTASLKCDLCDTQYETPAEWVRHIQSMHTETELAISNNSELPRVKRLNDRFVMKDTNKSGHRRCVTPKTVPLKKGHATVSHYNIRLEICDICNKDFSSYANMIVHRRTHTGDAFRK